ncbi:MAG: penicillin-binding protein 2 [Candidatus Dojkabacteria bacterium]|jgi:cell division protein FtsI/penicillin-binding protein 2|nr:penicillin-binding protein 2 [Candidatus Dojkabacteria bacterium]
MGRLHSLHSPRRKQKKSPIGDRIERNSYNFVIGIIVFIGLVIIAQAFRWQVVETEKFQTLAKLQYQDTDKQTAERGIIRASDGTILAVDQPVWNVYASLSNDERERELFFSQKDKYISTVASILAVEIDTISSKLTDDFMYVNLAKGVDTETKTALANANIFGDEENSKAGFGFYFERDVKRVYPNGELASHVIGFIGVNSEGEDIGQYGIEGFYFGDITGKEGYTYEEKDSTGNTILTAEYEPVLPRSGKDFTLTIRPSVQNKVEKILKEGVESTGSKSGSVIIMDPKTGEIISMAGYPTYNPNEYWRTSEPWIFKNLAVADVYEYGSVQKPITVAIALESGDVPKDFTCNDKTGYLDLYEVTKYDDLKGRKIYQWDKRPDGLQNLADMLKNSNNPCIARTALEVDFNYYYKKLREFGVGSFLGIGLQEESNSYLKSDKEWTRLDTITASYGQGIAATPLQVISALSTIANDGKRMRPYIIESISDEKENITFQPQVLSQPISEETADSVAEMMTHVIEDGGINEIYIDQLKDYYIAGKTGTAQVAKKGEAGYEEGKTITTFVGFAPADNAKMIMLVRLEEPKSNQYAANTVVPLWTKIFLNIVNDLEISKRN